MIRDFSKRFNFATSLALTVLTLLSMTAGSAIATIIQPEGAESGNQAGNSTNIPAKALAETQEILERASLIVFDGATTVQKQQVASVGKDTSEMLKHYLTPEPKQAAAAMSKDTAEMLKNYMASLTYTPKTTALPTDAEVLDEPWLANMDGASDGMVIPNLGSRMDDDGPADGKGMDLDLPNTPTAVKTFLKLLKPVQNALVTSPFGFRWGRPHQGIDMAAPVGTPIVSAEAGRVVYSGWKQGYGNFIAVDHGHGYETHYAHCSKLVVNLGQRVKKGQLIAKVGNTGHSTGPHLHFEVVANGIHRNPSKFLNQTLTVVHAH